MFINLIVGLIVIGVVLWLINTYLPMDGKIKKLLNVAYTIEYGVWPQALSLAPARLLGLPLAKQVDRRLSLDLELFSRGGMRVLRKIRECGYDVLSGRPAISRGERLRLLFGAMARVAFRRAA